MATGCFPPIRRPAPSRGGCSRKSRSCRSSLRTATPIRAGSPRMRPSPIRRGCSSSRTITCSACSTAAGCGSRISGSRGATARPWSRTRGSSGGASRRIITCSAARRRACGWIIPSPRCSISTCGSARTRRIIISTASRSAWRGRTTVRAPCSSDSTSRRSPPPRTRSIPWTGMRACGQRVEGPRAHRLPAGQCLRSAG